jgi:hypothetical protein
MTQVFVFFFFFFFGNKFSSRNHGERFWRSQLCINLPNKPISSTFSLSLYMHVFDYVLQCGDLIRMKIASEFVHIIMWTISGPKKLVASNILRKKRKKKLVKWWNRNVELLMSKYLGIQRYLFFFQFYC